MHKNESYLDVSMRHDSNARVHSYALFSHIFFLLHLFLLPFFHFVSQFFAISVSSLFLSSDKQETEPKEWAK